MQPEVTVPRTYDDFILDISNSDEHGYTLRVVHSSAGEFSTPYVFPFDSAALQVRLKDPQIALLRSGGARRSVLLPEEATVQEFGAALYDSIFAGEVRSLLETSRRTAASTGQGLRLRLRFQSAEMAALPWEYMFDKRIGDFVALAVDMPIVRHLPIIAAAEPLTVQPPLRVLGMIAAPANLPPIDVRAEQATVAKALRKLTAQGLVTLEWVEGQSWRALRQRMREEQWHVVHFMGHGSFDATQSEGILYFAADDGQADALTATEFNRILAGSQALRLVLLNACLGAGGDIQDIFSSTAATLVRGGVPAVIAMQYEIIDTAATEFARTFYEALVDGLPVDAAVDEARRAISVSVSNSLEWGIPVLFMRSADGHIFDLDAHLERVPARATDSVPGRTADPSHVPAPHEAPSELGRADAQGDNGRTKLRSWWAIGVVIAVLLAAGVWYAMGRNQTPGVTPPPSNAAALSADSDGDGLLDDDEVATYKTDPRNSDTDGDQLSDLEELRIWHTDPLKADSDGNGISDKVEIEARSAADSPAPEIQAPELTTDQQYGWNVERDSESEASVMLVDDDPAACALACRESTTCVAWWLEMNASGAATQCHLAAEAGSPVPDRIGAISGMSVAMIPYWNWNNRHAGASLGIVNAADPMQCQSLCDQNAQCAAWDFRKSVCGSITVPACSLYATGNLAYDTCFVAGFAYSDK
jgi:hypothetical protein